MLGGGATTALPALLDGLDRLLLLRPFGAILLSRFAVAPLAVKNYGLGALPSAQARKFAVAMPVGDFPATLTFAYAGHQVQSLLAVAEGSEKVGQQSLILAAVSIISTAILLYVIITRARRAMDTASHATTADARV